MAIIDVVKWQADADTFAWKFPHDNLSTLTQLIVHESQEAVMFSKGKMLSKFGPGKHTLSTENVPILRSLFGIPFGGDNPFTAEVWFVNKMIPLDIKWGTPSPIQLREPQYNIMVPVRAFGQFGIQIVDAEKFLVKLTGTMPLFDRDTLSKYFKGILIKHVADAVATTIVKEKVSVLEIAAEMLEISTSLKNLLAPEFEEYGIRIANFDVSSISVPEDDPSVVKLKEVLAKRMEMDTLGFTYQEERTYDAIETGAGNEGGMVGSVMGAGIGMGMGVNMGNMMGGRWAACSLPMYKGGRCSNSRQRRVPNVERRLLLQRSFVEAVAPLSIKRVHKTLMIK